MKITLKLPGGGVLKYEKKPMSEQARADLWHGLIFLCVMGFFAYVFWIFR